MTSEIMTNETMAKRLRDYALQLEKQGTSIFRARAFRAAAGQLQMMSRPVSAVFAEEGRPGLERLPGIGKSLAYTVEGLIRTGEVRTLRPLDAQREPDRHLASLPGIGPRTVELLRDRLGITTLEALRVAASRGSLADVGIGPGRVDELIAEIDRRLGEKRQAKNREEPSIETLLALDEEYRQRTGLYDLLGVAPRSYNPGNPGNPGCVSCPSELCYERNGWKLRALHADTALAHRLGLTHDWVVVYFDRGSRSGQRTVVTEASGDLAGQRVIRGREQECRDWYREHAQTTAGGVPAA